MSPPRKRLVGGEHSAFVAAMFVALLLVIISAPQAQAQNTIENPDVTIGVNGLSCPFCAYGLEQKLKKIDAVEALTVNMEEGQVQMKLKEGATITDEEIRAAVKDAGFTVTEITYAEKDKAAAKETDSIGRR
ncbi:MAG: hypothetical protein BMS9Abin05_2643 [Rhodothermia bacterium]|nr:MAG: hypothetical protein BMS9Abin05_2643 [Rhodothermia bacterium]